MNADKLAKLQASARIGGKGTPRRKVKKVNKSAGGSDDKKVQSTLKKFHVQPIPMIEEVNMFKANGQIMHFDAPKVQASIASNVFTISGNMEEKSMGDLMPGILTQLGAENLNNLKMIAEQMQAMQMAKDGGAKAEDDDVPELVENFDEVA